jgi:hypothetical protein
MAPRDKFTDLAKEKLEALYRDHATATIASMYGVNAETVRKRLIKLGIARRVRGARRDFDPPAKELAELYQTMSMAQIAKNYGVGETVVWKRLHEHGIELRDFKNHRLRRGRVFSEQHRENISKAQRGKFGPLNRNWRGGGVTVNCEVCKKAVTVTRARLTTFRFCSYECRSKWRTENWSGANHPQYQAVPRVLSCQHCGKEFSQRPTEAISEFRKRKFCSMECTKHGQYRLSGESHPLYKADSRRKNRRGKHGAWARAVISRDKATCQHCGATDVELHAHHILSFAEHPEQRWNIDNGMTLCHSCHWAVHTAANANGVNSGNILPGKAGENPEPSSGRKPVEGVTTRGRAYRRWEGSCEWCGEFISKRWSDTVGKAHLFCSRNCSGKYAASHRTYRRWKNAPDFNGGNASKNAAPERNDSSNAEN